MIDQNDQVSSAEQPGENAKIKVDLMSDFLFMDNCNTMLDDTNLIVISELGQLIDQFSNYIFGLTDKSYAL